MSFEKRSLINNMTATKKAIIASSPASPSVGSKVASKGGASLSKGGHLSKGGASLSKGGHLSKGGASLSKGGRLSKVVSKGGASLSKRFSKTAI
jgi:hypothetical protein